MHMHVLGESHGLQHFGTEHSTVPYFNPLVEQWVEGKDFK